MPENWESEKGIIDSTVEAHELCDTDRDVDVDNILPETGPNTSHTNFYSRSNVPGGKMPRNDALRLSSDMEPEDREFLFPAPPDRDRRKKSLPDNFSYGHETRSLSEMPRSCHKFRAHSISVTDPVCRSTYESLPKSPATSFLAQFAQPDDWGTRPAFDEGCTLGRYRLGKVIGRGSFSECREGSTAGREDTPDNVSPSDKLAMKIVTCDPMNNEGLLDFDRELSVWKRLKHRNILPLLDCLRYDNARVAVSPMAENGSLLQYINANGPLSEAMARIIFRQIAEALRHMHQEHGIVHRDLKLDNILLDAQLRPYVCDFGLSECTGQGPVCQETMSSKMEALCCRERSEGEIFCKGSLWYLPPEELDPNLLKPPKTSPGYQETIKKGDIWALGIILYALVSGRLPFTDDFLPRLQLSVIAGVYPPLPDHCSDKLRDLIESMLTVDVNSRANIDQVLSHPWLNS